MQSVRQTVLDQTIKACVDCLIRRTSYESNSVDGSDETPIHAGRALGIVVQAEGLEKTYQAGDVAVRAIRGVNFTIEVGAFVAFVGPSGSGKSTLLNLIGCLDEPSSGRPATVLPRRRTPD